VSYAGAVGLMQVISTEALDKYNANVLRKGKPNKVQPPGHPMQFEKAMQGAPPPGYEADFERLNKSPFDPESSIYAAAKKMVKKMKRAASHFAKINEGRVKNGLPPYNITQSHLEDYAMIMFNYGSKGGLGHITKKINASGSPDVHRWVNPKTGTLDIENKALGKGRDYYSRSVTYVTKARAGQNWYRKNRLGALQETIYNAIINLLKEQKI